MQRIPYRSWVEVSRERIAQNFEAVRETVGSGVEVMPVVKADAYRHGANEVSRVLETAGAHWLGVSSVEEGVSLREAGITTRILVMADFLPWEQESIFENQLTPAVHSLQKLSELDALAEKRGAHIPYHLKIDTGMGRLGTRQSTTAILEALSNTRHARLEGLMTHFASAALYSTGQTEQQIQYFQRFAEVLSAGGIVPKYRHLSATIPVAYGRREAWGTMVRTGHAIYGYVSPVRGQNHKRILSVKPALEWKAAVVEIKDVPVGAPVGYGAIFRAARPTRVGVLAVGYADGLPHRLTNRGRVLAGGKSVPILGAVSMDLTTVDLTEVPDVQPGDPVTILGRQGAERVDAQEIAKTAGTISYNVLCSISARVKRVYL
jgi:alanine racemase